MFGLLGALLAAYTVGDRYLVPADTWQRIQALPRVERTHTLATVHRVKRKPLCGAAAGMTG